MPDVLFTNFAFPAAGAPSNVTMPKRLNYSLNVKDFGAKGNGVTDDTDAINAVIDYAYTLGGNTISQSPRQFGAVIFFPPGIYLVSKGGTVRIQLDRYTDGVKWATLLYVGCGPNASIIRGT